MASTSGSTMHSMTSGYSFAEGLDLEDVFDIKAASSDSIGYLLDDDPSLKSFPINNGLFDDDRMGALWKPTDDDPHLDEVVILDTSDPPLAVLLGRTEDCFRGFPSPSNLPSPLTDSSASSPETSPWCEHWHPLPKQDPDPAIDIVLDKMYQKMRIYSPTPEPELEPTGHAETSSFSVDKASVAPSVTHSPSARDNEQIGEPSHVNANGTLNVELFRVEAAATIMPSSTVQTRPTAPPKKASLRPCRSSMAIAAASSPGPTSPISDSGVEAPHFDRQPRNRSSTPKDTPSAGHGVITVPPPISSSSLLSPNRVSVRRRADEADTADDDIVVDSQPPAKRVRVSPIRTTGEASRKKARITSSPSAGSSGSSAQGGRPKGPHKCPHPWCGSTFSRRGDVERHLRNASAHVTSVDQLDDRARCSKCGENLSRADARKRHELKGSCGKRTIRRRGVAIPRLPGA
ncbi:hypothetical protein BDN71DRAFT_707079 [Pleurotus eryngii]|uniref:C2H2-type domain-containing protein n=1 Tax=Pleurotus eryngii TaxID=5323 RepID=A0A9P6A780_PLEER|nr:hypothetical protein BDN71DRAFT_707079 [Pleurotus eryngii]